MIRVELRRLNGLPAFDSSVATRRKRMHTTYRGLKPTAKVMCPLRGPRTAAQWAIHLFLLGSKTQVNAQFGDSSIEVQALRLKKKSKYKSPSKKKT